MKKKVGVLALQGDFEAHSQALARAGAEPVLARSASDLEGLDGLVIPGGESTTMLKLLKAEDMVEPLVMEDVLPSAAPTPELVQSIKKGMQRDRER